MSFWSREPNGDNPHWLCIVVTALPVAVAMMLVWLGRPSPPPPNTMAEPTASPSVQHVPPMDQPLTVAERMP